MAHELGTLQWMMNSPKSFSKAHELGKALECSYELIILEFETTLN